MTIEIVGKYNGIVEVIDTAETETEAETLAAEYRMAFGPDWVIWYGVPCDVIGY